MAMADIRMMEGHLDIIEEVMNQPPSDDQRTMVNEMFRECAEHRKVLEQEAVKALERDGGETFNQITTLLDRLERIKEDWQHRLGSSPHLGPSGDPMPPFPPVGSTQQPAFHPNSQSPMSSAAAASEGGERGEGTWRGGGMESIAAKKKKREKKGRRQDNIEEFPQEFGFPSSGFGQAPEAAELGSSVGFAGWPAASSGAMDAGATAGGASGSMGMGGSAWGTDAAVGSVAPAWPSGHDTTMDAGFDGTWGAASSFPASAADPPADRRPSAPASHPAQLSRGHSLEGPAPTFGSFEEPLPRRPPDVGLVSHSFDAGIGSHGALGSHGFDVVGLGSRGSHGSHGYGGDLAALKATLHIRRPFSEVEFDRDGFGKMFAQVAAQAVGVPAHRIRISAVRPGM